MRSRVAQILLLFTVLAGPVSADSLSQVQKTLVARYPEVKAQDIAASPIPGLYQVSLGADVVYVTADGKYALHGNLIEMDSHKDMTEQARRKARLATLASLPLSDLIIYGPEDPKYTITVFDDLDCPYCAALYHDMPAINALGIQVRVASFPRAGIDSPSFVMAEKVWCSSDRLGAFGAAQHGVEIAGSVCQTNPVAQEYGLGMRLGIHITPTSVTDQGAVVDGYNGPQWLLQQILAANGS
jgi:thiol:disulfide interchange protein DsbC